MQSCTDPRTWPNSICFSSALCYTVCLHAPNTIKRQRPISKYVLFPVGYWDISSLIVWDNGRMIESGWLVEVFTATGNSPTKWSFVQWLFQQAQQDDVNKKDWALSGCNRPFSHPFLVDDWISIALELLKSSNRHIMELAWLYIVYTREERP